MITKTQEKLIKTLHTKKGRDKSGLCLAEGKKVVELATGLVKFSFGPKDSNKFYKLVTTETPPDLAAVVRAPKWVLDDIKKEQVVVLLDGVQDPGNVGAIFRLCLGFGAVLILVESADPTNSKVIRSSAGSMFQVPWLQVPRNKIDWVVKELGNRVYRLEKRKGSVKLNPRTIKKPALIIAGSEGQGIKTNVKGTSVYINHSPKLESLNVGQALTIVLYGVG